MMPSPASPHGKQPDCPSVTKPMDALSFEIGCAAVDYSDFGEYGPLFQERYRNVWETAARMYAVLRALGDQAPIVRESVPLPDLASALTTEFDQGGFWCKYLTAAGLAFQRETEIAKLWPKFQAVFSPPLATLSALGGDLRRYGIRSAVLDQSYSPAVVGDASSQLNRVCFGPYTGHELSYITAHHPRVLEAGAGSGYLTNELCKRGVDAIGFDDNTYGFSEQAGFDWISKLRSEGRLLVQPSLPTRDQQQGRTLLISWPMPGTRMLIDLLDGFEKSGGNQLLLKVGGFAVPRKPEHFTNVLRFFDRLAKNWRQVPESVSLFSPWKLENNLFAFRRAA